ncbi:DUF2802 domain-containing protein [Legionella taurinensis]|uniref:DUF2802 domain-containing protein n=1 Tax=Legionella taurinensis TaxID=70611 RepID=A0A3A5L545_9GAMM|nr:DUF2802 domain-containing protein [Legionella taurinensis]MDX1837353.1 DUF2802 domain-containing protein [Legionella taurinensis]PUT40707.1 DUF2802 domain-containing protein [Legionella taurinensis]PUT44129.1 DUF2802 domain-containing protein [Legionella taurinensis]PUT47430.1 DUF2802 domain-containing protein [Legionella taurinensis]PUT48569.1 DUF2802 domain-containing protein [Legionella taurinensis]
MSLIVIMELLLTLGLAYVIYHQRQQLLDVEKRLNILSQSMDQHQLEQAAVVNADLVFAKKLAEINSQLVSMDNQLQSLETKRDNDGGYQHALKILEMGGNKDEIISSCHLSNAEAELLMNLHAYRAVIKTPA